MRQAVHYLPILTTFVAVIFATDVLRRYASRGGLHLLWWGIGLVTYGAGTVTESLTTLFGWHELVFRLWYIAGALLGGAPLAQGTVYLLFPRKTAHRMTAGLLAAITFGAVAVFLTPIDYAMVEPYRLAGRVMEWRWVRLISPFINLYAVIFLIGGAIVSARRYAGDRSTRHRFIGNVLIAIGAILPGIGGTATRMGHVEVLYVTELAGLLLIYAGYRANVSPPVPLRQELV